MALVGAATATGAVVSTPGGSPPNDTPDGGGGSNGPGAHWPACTELMNSVLGPKSHTLVEHTGTHAVVYGFQVYFPKSTRENTGLGGIMRILARPLKKPHHEGRRVPPHWRMVRRDVTTWPPRRWGTSQGRPASKHCSVHKPARSLIPKSWYCHAYIRVRLNTAKEETIMTFPCLYCAG